MKCQSLFSEKYKKNINNLSSAELAHRVVMLKTFLKPCRLLSTNGISDFPETVCACPVLSASVISYLL